MPMNEEEVRAECDGALADAGFMPEEVRFFRLAELGVSHIGATWFRPHKDIEADDQGFPGDEPQREEANRAENRDLHRIAVPAEPSDRATFAALVRHELEHARQWDAMLGVFDLYDFIVDAIFGTLAGGLDGCRGGLINTIPAEIDCNAAASVYIAGRCSAAEVQAVRDGPRTYLACSHLLPPPCETLPARMVAFMFIHRAAVECYARRRGFPVATILWSVHPKARTFWEQLEEGMAL